MLPTPESQHSDESPEREIGDSYMVLYTDGTMNTVSATEAEELRRTAAKQQLEFGLREATLAQQQFKLILKLVANLTLYTHESMVQACQVLVDMYPGMEHETLRQLRNFLIHIDNQTNGYAPLLEKVIQMLASTDSSSQK